MSFTRRIKAAVKAWYEAERYRPGRPYTPRTHQDARLDISKATRVILQGKARYWERNSALINRLADIFECYVVGSGLQVNPASSDQEWNDRAKVWWRTWERFADIASRQTFGTLQGLITRAWFIDGEAFVLLVQGETGRPRLQILEAHRVETPPDLQDKEGSSIVDGVEIDPSSGRPVKYWIWEPIGNGQKKYKALPAEQVLHVFEPQRPGQYRGLPFFTAALNTIDDLDELKKLEQKAARSASIVANILVNVTGEVDPAELLRNGGAVDTASTGSEVTAYQERLGGETIVLKAGEDLKQFQSNRPSVVTRDYWRDLQAEVCASCGIPAVLVFPDQMQGTQYRGSLDMAATFFRSRSAVMQEVVRRIYEWVMREAGRRATRNNDQELLGAPQDFWRVSIQPPRSVNVDVGRNSAAMLAELAAGATNFELIYAPQGLDWREEGSKLAEQLQYFEALGIKLPFLNGANSANREEPQP